MTLRYAYAADLELQAAAKRVGQVIVRMSGFPGACTENPAMMASRRSPRAAIAP